MSKRLIIKFSRNRKSQTDWERVDALDDATIDYRDIPPTDIAFWQNGRQHPHKTNSSRNDTQS